MAVLIQTENQPQQEMVVTAPQLACINQDSSMLEWYDLRHVSSFGTANGSNITVINLLLLPWSLRMAKIIVFLRPIPLNVQLTVVDMKES